MSYGELMSGETNVLDSLILPHSNALVHCQCISVVRIFENWRVFFFFREVHELESF